VRTLSALVSVAPDPVAADCKQSVCFIQSVEERAELAR